MTRQCRFQYGTEVRLTGVFRNAAGNRADPSTVYFDLVSPSRVRTSVQYGVDGVIREEEGLYYYEFIPDEFSSSHAWKVTLRGVTDVTQTDVGWFWVMPNP